MSIQVERPSRIEEVASQQIIQEPQPDLIKEPPQSPEFVLKRVERSRKQNLSMPSFKEIEGVNDNITTINEKSEIQKSHIDLRSITLKEISK